MYLMRRIFFLCQPASLVRVGHEEGKGDVGGKRNTEYKSLSFRETKRQNPPLALLLDSFFISQICSMLNILSEGFGSDKCRLTQL